MDGRECLIWSAIAAAVLAIVLTPIILIGVGGIDFAFDAEFIPSVVGLFLGIFVVVFLPTQFILYAIHGLEDNIGNLHDRKNEYVSLTDDESMAVLEKTISEIPVLYSVALKNKQSGNLAWCDEFLESTKNIVRLRSKAWEETETKFTKKEIKYYFRLWFNRL